MFKRTPVTSREWALFGLRWVIPAGLLLAVFPTQGLWPPAIPALVAVASIFAAVTNLLLALLLLGDYWARFVAGLAVIIDAALVCAGIYLTASPLIWLGLVPVLMAGLYFNWAFSLITGAVVAGIAMALQLFILRQGVADLPTTLLAAAVLVAVGPIVSLSSLPNGTSMPVRVGRRSGHSEQPLKVATEYMRVVYEMAEVLSASRLDPKRVLEAAVEFGPEGLQRVGVRPPLFSAILLFAESDDDLGTVLRVARASSSVTPSDHRVTVPGVGGVIAKALSTAAPALATSPATDPELREFESFRTCQTVLCLPLGVGQDSYGVMLVGSQEPYAFKDTHVELMRAVANQAAASLHSARLYVALREQRDRIIEVEKTAREQLASSLHDGPTQGLAALTMRLNYIRRLIEKQPELAISELYQVEDLARRTTKEIRHVLFELRPKALERGFEAGLQQLAAKMKETYDQNVEIVVEAQCDRLLDAQTAQTLFSIVTECVNNSRKHAAASLIRVYMGVQHGLLVLEVSDNGRGFDVQQALAAAREREGHLGLLNLQERAALVEGTLTIESEIGKGTRTTVTIPLEVLRLRSAEESSRQAEHEMI